MIKNGYLLSLIADILDGVGKRKVFTKLDLRWGYNNIRIKEGDKWKVAFTIHIRAYELTVMYFGLTNSSATFQIVMNNIFQDLINQGDTATFIDDITLLENFLWKCNMGYTLYLWISLLEPTLETFYKPQT